MTLSEPPSVSVIVLSMGRPETTAAVNSVARQDYPSVETIVVDATGGGRPRLPSLPRPAGHIVRTFGGDGPLSRAHAANVGLLSAQGEWLCFLDDNGAYDEDFISAMIKSAGNRPDALVVYGRTRILRADGQVDRLFGRPFNRALMHYQPLFCWQAALIRRRVVELGCRFDEAMETCEDRDFLAQIAEHSDFAFVPVVGFNYRPDRGTSGGPGTTPDVANAIRFERLLRAKTAGAGAYHNRRASWLYMRALGAQRVGDRMRSRKLFDALLKEYPDDPSALHGAPGIELEQRLLEHADTLAGRALETSTSAAECRLERRTILGRLGRCQDAVSEAIRAARKPTPESTTEEFMRQPAPVDAVVLPETVAVRVEAPAVSLGSGESYETSCGRAVANAAPSKAERIVQQAGTLFFRGEALRAKALIDTLTPADIGNPELLRTAGEICLELRSLEQAFAFLDRSAKLLPSARVEELLTICCDRLWKDRARASAHALALRLRERIEKRAHRSPTRGPIHVLGTLGTIGGSETRAVSLYRTLSAHADVRLWSTVPPIERQYPGLPIQVLEPARGAFPNGGTLILAGHYFDCGDWWRDAAFDRVVICVNTDNPKRLVHRLTDIEENTQVARIDFTFASQLSRDVFGLPGQIEYSFVDVTRFAPATPRDTESNHLTLGRHSRDVRLKHHPNDPALYRELVARGHRLRLLGGTWLQGAFSGDSIAPSIELLSTGNEDPCDFLSGLDCFIYRKHPHFFETGSAAILEAMAMALPMVVFRDGVGAAEIIESGQDGFLVDTDAEALACIDRLAAEPSLRAAIGSAARRKVTAVMQDQQRRILDYYLGSA